ncbi:hypothetical protein [Mycobacterium sp.]|uniref:hypothetical protein n=1 Tax=Mycobacterium sp. TaxID=1785 RepID=UPI002625A673|nr:hypothetical protein [Mycobacterium sp.]
MKLKPSITDVQAGLNRRLTAMETRAHKFYDDPAGGRTEPWVNLGAGAMYRWVADRVIVMLTNVAMTGGEVTYQLPVDTAPSAPAGRYFDMVDGADRYPSHIFVGDDALVHVTSTAPDGVHYSATLDWPGGELA